MYLIDTKRATSTIDPKLHGQFIEFLGECIDQGIWVGPDSDIPSIDGFRKEIVEKLKELHPAIIRWPGGCYADTYHWREGIGPRENRPVTFNENFGTFKRDDHQFGTDEFMKLCELVGAEPWININLMTGSVQEMKDWMEYCNRPSGTDLSDLRAKNGHPAPYNVKYWGIGNEVWSGGGFMTPAQYAEKYREYSTAMPSFKSSVEDKDHNYRIASGPDGNKPIESVTWTQDLLKELASYRQPSIQALDLHYYNWNLTGDDSPTEFNEESWYRVLNGARAIGKTIDEQLLLIREGLARMPQPESSMDSRLDHLDLVVGEWGVWHKDSFTARPALKQQVTMRDAIATALTLNVLQNHCEDIKIATVAQSVNVLNSLFLTEGKQTIVTPNYDVFQMYQHHKNGQLIPLNNEDPKVELFASIKDGIITITAINLSYHNEKEITLDFLEGKRLINQEVLHANDVHDVNDVEHPNQVRLQQVPVKETTKQQFRFVLPNASVTNFQFKN